MAIESSIIRRLPFEIRNNHFLVAARISQNHRVSRLERGKRNARPFLSLEEQETLNLWNKQFFLGYVEALEYLKPVPISLSALIVDGKGKYLIQQIQEALTAGASVNDDLRNGHRPLQLALAKGHKEVALLLIEHGADIHYRDRSGQTPLQVLLIMVNLKLPSY